ncbi:hypothetical protein GCM10027046_30150 [Uliginosibacterium flavum]|uniref:Hemagglutinin repeat-containing protein n=1 Tax=Uliginosibacterium flavum TaxID=1396831 RepID=A0ABV2TID8_9RHOO
MNTHTSSALQTTTSAAEPQQLWRRATALVTAVFFIAQPGLATAQLVADPNAGARRPQIDAAANGVPVVQITAPSAGGVSRNQYQQFNVGPQGLILNNSTTNVQTQQAGWIEGNRNLSGGSARVILNEVTSSHPSFLRGHTEVAGSRAEAIIANPNGITCDGCGFINTTRGVLTTGVPQFGGDGSLEAYRVTGGSILVSGAGLNASNIDQVDLIARSLSINADIWSTRLNLIAGSNLVKHSDLSTQTIAGDGAQPSVAIDVGSLGGMYANKIKLVGTEAGLGVTNAGNISALDGNLEIDAKGHITITGKASATGDARITSSQDVINSGTLYAQQQTTIAADGAFTNASTGLVGARGSLAIQAASVESAGEISSGLKADGITDAATTPGDLTITSRSNVILSGSVASTGNLEINAAQAIVNRGSLYSQQNASLRSGDKLSNTAAGLIAAQGNLTIDAGSVDSAGVLMAGLRPDNSTATTGDLTLTSQGIATLSGQQLAAGKLQVSASELRMAGSRSSANGDLSLTATAGQIDLSAASTDAGGTASVRASAALINTQGGINAARTDIAAASLDNRQGSIKATGITGASQITLSGDLENSSGSISAASSDLTISAAKLNNAQGSIQHTGTGVLRISASDINNSQAEIAGNGHLNLQAATLGNQNGLVASSAKTEIKLTGALNNQSGTLASYTDLDLQAQGAVSNQAGTIEARGDASSLTLAAASIDNADGRIVNLGQGDANISSQTSITNSNASGVAGKGIIGGQGKASLTAASLSNTQNGQLVASDALRVQLSGAAQNNAQILANTLDLNAASFDNAAGKIETDADIKLSAASINNLGQINAGQDLLITTTGSLANSAGNVVKANRDLTLQAGGSITNEGELSAVQKATITAASLDNRASGKILAQQIQTNISGRLDNAGRIQGEFVDLGANQLSNTSLITGRYLTARTTDLVNQGSAAEMAAFEQMDLQVTGKLSNTDGANLYSAKTLMISADGKTDVDGLLINNSREVLNSSATIQAGGNLLIAANETVNERTMVIVEESEKRTGESVVLPSPAQCGQGSHTNCTRYTTFYKTEQVQSGTTPAARLLSGGNMWLMGSVTNAYSNIAAGGDLWLGDLLLKQASQEQLDQILKQTSRSLQEKEIQSGQIDNWKEVWDHRSCSTFGGCTDFYRWDNYAYAFENTRSYQVGTLAATITSNGAINIDATKVTIETVGAGNTPGLNSSTLGATQSGNPARATGPGATPVTPAPQSIPGFTAPGSALYTVRTEPGQRYLVETDPRFASYSNFISSDYMLSRLGINPEGAQKRFGDGFYEQQTVLDQILQLSGRRYLGQFASAEDQFKALMDSGIASATAFGITVGVTLTGEQIASLTSDIVWLEEREVTVGSKTEIVLVPVVYLTRLHADDLRPSGALIAAEDVVIRASGSITNSGTISGNVRTALLGNSVTNEGGIITSKGLTLVDAKEDLINRSAKISGNTVQLSAGRDLRIERIAPTAVQLGSVSTTRVFAASDISAKDSLDIYAGRDLTLAASKLKSEGSVSLAAARNLTVEHQTATERMTNATGELSQTAQLTSQIAAGTDLRLEAGDTLKLAAAKLSADGSVAVIAKGDIELTAATAQQSSRYSGNKVSDRKLDETTTGTSILAGSDIYIQAGATSSGSQAQAVSTAGAQQAPAASTTPGNNLSMQGATLISTNGSIAVGATGNISITEARERHESEEATSSSKKGLFSSSSSSTYDLSKRDLAVTSTVIGKNVELRAGQDITLRGAQIAADQDILASAGGTIRSEEARNLVQEDHRVTSSSKGISVNVRQGSVGYSSSRLNAGETYEGKLVVGSDLSAGGNLTLLANDAIVLRATTASAGGNTGSAQNLSAIGEAKQTDHTESAVSTSSIDTAGGKLTILAKDVRLEAANDEEHTRTWSEVGGRNMVINNPGRELAGQLRAMGELAKSTFAIKNATGMELMALNAKDRKGIVKDSIIPKKMHDKDGKPDDSATQNRLGKVVGRTFARDNGVIQKNNAAITEGVERHYSRTQQDEISEITTSTARVTQLTSSGDTLISADNITAQGARISSTNGNLSLIATNDINLDVATSREASESHVRDRRATLPNNHVITEVSHTTIESPVGTELAGKNVTVSAGNNLSATALLATAEEDLTLKAGKRVDLLAAAEIVEQDARRVDGTRGIYKSGRTSATIGSKQTPQSNERVTVLPQGATLVAGRDITMEADDALVVQASDLVAGRNITGKAGTIDILAMPGQDVLTESASARDGGVKVAAKSTFIDLANMALDAVERYQAADNSANAQHERRMAALQGAQTALDAYKAYSAANGNGKSATTFGVEVTLGNQRNTVVNVHDRQTISPNTLQAGGDIDLNATKGDATLTASKLDGQNISITAAKDINLVGLTESDILSERRSSHSGYVGVGYGAGWYITAGGSRSLGHGRGTEENQVETELTAQNKLTLKSGQDTTLIGAKAVGETIKVDVGRNLNLASQQDRDDYKSNDYAGSIAGTFGAGQGGVTGSASFNHLDSQYKSVLEQTGFYAGKGGYDIYVGKNTDLKGAVIASSATSDKNRLSTETLTHSDIDNKAKYLAYGASLSFSSSYERKENTTQSGGAGSSPTGSSANTGSTTGTSDSSTSSGNSTGSGKTGSATTTTTTTKNSSSAGLSLPQSKSVEGTTTSAISEGRLEIRSGQSTDISRDTANANGKIDPIFDQGEIRRKAEYSQKLSQVAFTAVGELKLQMQKSAEREQTTANVEKINANAELSAAQASQARIDADPNGSQADRQAAQERVDSAHQQLGAADQHLASATQSLTRWSDGGLYSTALHGAIGAVVANAGGGNAAAGGLSAGVTEVTGTLVEQYLSANFTKEQLSEVDRKAIQQVVAIISGAAVGGLTAQATGGSTLAGAGSGATTSLDGERFNRQLHVSERARLRKKAQDIVASKLSEISKDAASQVTESTRLAAENYWYAQLESEASALVDPTNLKLRNSYLQQIAATDQSLLNGGYSAGNYLDNANYARSIVQSMAGETILGLDNKPIIADGSELKTFQATTRQYNDSTLFAFAPERVTDPQIDYRAQFDSLAKARNAQARQSGAATAIDQATVGTTEQNLLDYYRGRSGGAEQVCPECNLIGAGPLIKSAAGAVKATVSGVLKAGEGKAAVGVVSEVRIVEGGAKGALDSSIPAGYRTIEWTGAQLPAGSKPVVELATGEVKILTPGGQLASPPLTGPQPIGQFTPPTNLLPGTTLFGDNAHVQAAKLLQSQYPDVPFTFRVAPGQTGVDVSVPVEYAKRVGFEHAEIKPLSPSGIKAYETQVSNWGLDPKTVKPIYYDSKGNLYRGN